MEGRGLDLAHAFVSVAAAGLWPTELRVLRDEGWTPVLSVSAVARALAPQFKPLGLFGVWSEADGAARRACLFADGVVWAETEVLAERLLILLGSLSDE
jgi:hypothetical protein